MISIHPVLLDCTEQLDIDELPAQRHHRGMLEAQEGLVAKGVLGLNFLDDDHI